MHQIDLADLGAARRMRSRWARRACALGLSCACTMAAAAGWVGLLKNTAAESFQEEDLRMFLDAAGKALNAEGPRVPVEWSNAENGTGGSFLVAGKSVGTGGAPCKRVRFSTYATKYPPSKSSTTWTACKAPDGPWKLASTK